MRLWLHELGAYSLTLLQLARSERHRQEGKNRRRRRKNIKKKKRRSEKLTDDDEREKGQQQHKIKIEYKNSQTNHSWVYISYLLHYIIIFLECPM